MKKMLHIAMCNSRCDTITFAVSCNVSRSCHVTNQYSLEQEIFGDHQYDAHHPNTHTYTHTHTHTHRYAHIHTQGMHAHTHKHTFVCTQAQVSTRQLDDSELLVINFNWHVHVDTLSAQKMQDGPTHTWVSKDLKLRRNTSICHRT